MILLGVNIDHIATLRQARGERYPDPVDAAFAAERAGADSITVHLREDRRHIQDRDVVLLQQTCQTKINLEMAASEPMLTLAERWKPQDCCLVPEKRHELTTEGGLDVVGNRHRLADAVARLHDAGIRVSLFVDPDLEQISAAGAIGATVVEMHTGRYANAATQAQRNLELEQLYRAAHQASLNGLTVHAGHGLTYHNVQPIARLPDLKELNIGHAIIARAVMVGMESAVKEMKRLMREAVKTP
ncbi:pyridoxine 5'-phosphate synthase [Magnetococcus marinus MC-1]|uniref:Pyridoxine 5'-phosphate synthase n=1 Tax=Magnetococcus marinus (strain ATCC BAA-1437 / JCM 17883 / MC-1) TaxID=156889 RepID=PDXJ_MAGMM|nr:pyridoxine 5'-phosphate synthase [Magnetococcus marinus]A0L8S5.1 RecName: Full=Pyridoxine 5'-phosphate synthase; Short=PNP synthase [Magnetococcus marinus MC-1]ABK44368.1 pyridoxine 5'-phosphate synthase [Magnetococcus marinus MC-1]